MVGDNDHLQFGEGWHALEPLDRPIRWTARAAAFHLHANGGQTLCLTCNSYKPNLEESPTNGRVEVEGETIGAFRIERTEWSTIRFQLPSQLTARAAGGKIDGRLVIENPWRPHLELKSSFQEAVIGRGTTVEGSRDPASRHCRIAHLVGVKADRAIFRSRRWQRHRLARGLRSWFPRFQIQPC